MSQLRLMLSSVGGGLAVGAGIQISRAYGEDISTDAKSLKRNVFAVPGNITSKLSGGTNELIKSGAIAITGANDVCEYYHISSTDENTSTSSPQTDDPKECLVLKALSEKALSIDEICYKTALSLSELNSILLIMEVKDLIKKTGADLYTPVLK